MEPEIKETTEDLGQENLPTITKRFQSLIIDQVFIIICMILLSQLFSQFDPEQTAGLRGLTFFIFCLRTLLGFIRMHCRQLHFRYKS